MIKKLIILSIALQFFLFNCKQITNAQTEKTDDAQQVRNDTETKDQLDSLFQTNGYTRDTLADGTTVVELTNAQTPYLPDYSTEQTSSVFNDRYRKKILFNAIIIISILVGCSIIYFTTIRSSKKARKNYLENLRIFKQGANKIQVHLQDCKIKQRTRYEKIEKTYRQQELDAIDSQIFGIHRNDTKELYSCTVTYEAIINGNIETFCTEIDKDELTLNILFAQQKTTYIYVDKSDKENYYFDLEFLNRL